MLMKRVNYIKIHEQRKVPLMQNLLRTEFYK
jgi:hypothetical protein